MVCRSFSTLTLTYGGGGHPVSSRKLAWAVGVAVVLYLGGRLASTWTTNFTILFQFLFRPIIFSVTTFSHRLAAWRPLNIWCENLLNSICGGGDDVSGGGVDGFGGGSCQQNNLQHHCHNHHPATTTNITDISTTTITNTTTTITTVPPSPPPQASAPLPPT